MIPWITQTKWPCLKMKDLSKSLKSGWFQCETTISLMGVFHLSPHESLAVPTRPSWTMPPLETAPAGSSWRWATWSPRYTRIPIPKIGIISPIIVNYYQSWRILSSCFCILYGCIVWNYYIWRWMEGFYWSKLSQTGARRLTLRAYWVYSWSQLDGCFQE